MLYWNLNVSYGLLQTWDRNNFGLRKKMMYPQWMYYMLLAYDLPARFIFIIFLFLDPKVHTILAEPLLFSSILFGIELIRRYCWFLMRVENEQVCSIEKFREIEEIPELM